jgi:hypothetical protein
VTSEDIRQIGKATDDSPQVANAIASGLAALGSVGADLQTKSGTWGMKVDRDTYRAALLRGPGSVHMAFEQVARGGGKK